MGQQKLECLVHGLPGPDGRGRRLAITGCEGLLVSSLGLPLDISHNIVVVKGVGKTRNKNNKQLSSRPMEEEELSPSDKLTVPARH